MNRRDQAVGMYGVAVEEFQARVVTAAEKASDYDAIVTREAEILQHRAERIAQETGMSVRLLHAYHLLRIRV